MIQLVLSFVATIQPLLLEQVMNYIESDTTEQKAQTKAIIFALILLLYMMLSKIIIINIGFYVMKFIVQLKQSLVSMMYAKILKVSVSTNKRFNQGRLVNMILNDSHSAVFVFEQIPAILVVPFTLIFILTSLYFLIDYVIIVPIIIIMFLYIINYVIARIAAILQRKWYLYIDKRFHKINE